MTKRGKVFKAILTTKGRKTGKEHSVWLLAVLHDGKVYFSRHRPNGDWFQNASVNSDVIIDFDNKRHVGKASVITNGELARKISQLKYPGEERAKEKRVVLEVTLHE